MSTKKAIRTGLTSAVGVLIGCTLVGPFLSHGSFGRGAVTGLIAGALVLATWSVIALRSKDAPACTPRKAR